MKNVTLYFLSMHLLFGACSKKDAGIFPEESSITEALYASATIEPEGLYQAFTAVSGIVEECFVREGDLVIPGQPIYSISDETSQLSTQQARLMLDQSIRNYRGEQNILQELKTETEAARLKYVNDSALYYRQKELWSKKVGSQIELENRKLAFELSRAQWQTSIKRKKRTESELANQVKQAENNLKSTTSRQNEHLIKSRVYGKVYALFKEPGEFVSIQERLAYIGDSINFTILLAVDEAAITRVKTNQEVWIRLEAYRGRVFQAKITRILPKMDERNQTFQVEAQFTKRPDYLYMGLTGEANIVVDQKEKTLVIPREYLLDGSVLTQTGLKKVKTGLTSMSHVEIVEGIDAQTRIFKPITQ